MSLKKNVIANFVSQIYVALIGIVMVPIYVRYMGVEAYGLVGFFVMLQAWFQLLDMGLTSTVAREAAIFKAGEMSGVDLRRLLRTLEGIFFALALFGGLAIIGGAGSIATSWLNVERLSLSVVQHAVMLMGLIVALRWVCGLYRGVLSGFEHLVWLGHFNVIAATARYVLVIPFMTYAGSGPLEFFGFQLLVSVMELMVLVSQTYSRLPRLPDGQKILWSWLSLRPTLKFSLSIAFTSSVWVLVTQSDKLILSKLLTLTDYAYFTLAVLVAGGIAIISGPISSAFSPRMAKLSAMRDDAGLIELYRNATQLVGVVTVPTVLILAFFSEPILWVWTGDKLIASQASSVLTLYAVGNGILALAAFPYYLQFAKGDLKLHLWGSVLFAVFLIPCLIFATFKYGVTGAGYAWLIVNALYFLMWVPRVHKRFFEGLHQAWLWRDILPIVFWPTCCCTLVYFSIQWSPMRLLASLEIVTAGVVLLAISALSSSVMRDFLTLRYGRYFAKRG